MTMPLSDEKELELELDGNRNGNGNGNGNGSQHLPLQASLQQQNENQIRNPLSKVPKRKPVPVAPTGAVTPAGTATATATTAAYTLPTITDIKQRWLTWKNSLTTTQRRRAIIITIGIAITVLLALIIGLSVGLTVGKRHKNLPLPTTHGGPYTGDLTYYDPGLGSCGFTSSGSEMICAVSHVIFDAASTGSNPNANPLCGRRIRVRRGKRSVDVRVVDRCVGCKETDLDVSRAVFGDLAELDLGRVVVEWAWLEDVPVSVH